MYTIFCKKIIITALALGPALAEAEPLVYAEVPRAMSKAVKATTVPKPLKVATAVGVGAVHTLVVQKSRLRGDELASKALEATIKVYSKNWVVTPNYIVYNVEF